MTWELRAEKYDLGEEGWAKVGEEMGRHPRWKAQQGRRRGPGNEHGWGGCGLGEIHSPVLFLSFFLSVWT